MLCVTSFLILLVINHDNLQEVQSLKFKLRAGITVILLQRLYVPYAVQYALHTNSMILCKKFNLNNSSLEFHKIVERIRTVRIYTRERERTDSISVCELPQLLIEHCLYNPRSRLQWRSW
jgi:hypothetical protein